MYDQEHRPFSNQNLNEVSPQMAEQIFNPLMAEEDPTLPTKYMSARSMAPFFFSGTNSPFTPTSQEGLELEIDGLYFGSVDRYVWEMKFLELTGAPPTSDNFRGILKRRCVNSSDLERWVVNRGILYLQKAILKKIQMDQSFYEALMNTRNRYIFYTYMKDNFFATGKATAEMKSWLKQLESSNVYLRIPLRFPLRYQDLACTVKIPGGGHNVLGTIYMALREAIKTRGVHLLEVKIPEMDQPVPDIVRLATSANERTNNKRDNEHKWVSKQITPQQGTSHNYPGLKPLNYAQSTTSRHNDAESTVSRHTAPHFPSNRQSHTEFNSSASISFFNKRTNPKQQRDQMNENSYEQPATKHMKYELKDEEYYDGTYSTMPTPSAYSVASEALVVNNWQSEDQLDILEKTREKQARLEEARRMLEDPLDPTIAQMNEDALQVINDEELIRRLLSSNSPSSHRTTSTVTNTPAAHRLRTLTDEEEGVNQQVRHYKPIKKELNN